MVVAKARQIDERRQPAALTRLHRYIGLEVGGSPFLELTADRIREQFPVSGLLGPTRDLRLHPEPTASRQPSAELVSQLGAPS